MTVKVKWDKYEAAILLDSYFKVEKGELKRADAIAKVSAILRNRALVNNVELDDTFRNPNGISCQLGAMQYVVTGGKRGIPHAPMLFQRIYKLYRQNPVEFDNVLKAAIRQAQAYNKVKSSETYQDDSSTDGSASAKGQSSDVALSNDIAGFKQWMREVGLAEGSVRSYASAIRNVEEFASSHGYLGYAFYGNDDILDVSKMVERLCEDRAFIDHDDGQHNRLRSALRKFQQFISSSRISPCSKGVFNTADDNRHSDSESTHSVVGPSRLSGKYDETVAEVLRERFPNGYNDTSAIDQARLLEYCREKQHISPEAAADIIETVHRIGHFMSGRIYAPLTEEMASVIHGIAFDVEQVLNSGAIAVSNEMVYKKYENVARTELRLYSPEPLTELVSDFLSQNISVKKGYYLALDGKPGAKDDVLRYLRSVAVPVDFDELCDVLWYHRPEDIRSVVNGCESVARVATGAYLYAYDAPISPDELSRIKRGLNEALLVGTVVSDNELRALVGKVSPAVLVNTDTYASYGLRNVLAVLLGSHFTYSGAGIGKNSRQQSASDMFLDYCRERDSVSLQELKELADSLNRTGLCWNQIYESMIRVSRDEFLSKRSIEFDVNAIDAVIGTLCDGDYIAIKDAELFSIYPVMSYKWNCFLLESYVNSYSDEFILIHMNFAETDCCGAIVKRASGIQTYEDLVVDILRDYDDWSTTSDALKYLVDRGFQQRRTCRNINELIKQAIIARDDMRG